MLNKDIVARYNGIKIISYLSKVEVSRLLMTALLY
jgi:hypothetical protein